MGKKKGIEKDRVRLVLPQKGLYRRGRTASRRSAGNRRCKGNALRAGAHSPELVKPGADSVGGKSIMKQNTSPDEFQEKKYEGHYGREGPEALFRADRRRPAQESFSGDLTWRRNFLRKRVLKLGENLPKESSSKNICPKTGEVAYINSRGSILGEPGSGKRRLTAGRKNLAHLPF